MLACKLEKREQAEGSGVQALRLGRRGVSVGGKVMQEVRAHRPRIPDRCHLMQAAKERGKEK